MPLEVCNNADNTMFEFLESFELGNIYWGNNRHRASKLIKHLSVDLKDKLMTCSDSYALMRKWLINNYGGGSRIVNDTIMALGRRKKLAVNDCLERYSHLSAIIAALKRLEKLPRTNLALGTEVNDCLHSWNTLTSLSMTNV